MAIISMKALLESGVHFGHRTNKWDPAMKPYIFTERNGIHIIDLQQTVKALEQCLQPRARHRCRRRHGALRGHQAPGAGNHPAKKPSAAACPTSPQRWLGGMLTNWRTIRQRINELERLERMRDTRRVRAPDQERRPADQPRDRAPRDAPGRHPQHEAPARACSSWSTSSAKRPPSTKPTCSTSRSSPWSTPTATPAASITSSPPTTTPSAPSSCWSARSPTPSWKGEAMRKEEEDASRSREVADALASKKPSWPMRSCWAKPPWPSWPPKTIVDHQR